MAKAPKKPGNGNNSPKPSGWAAEVLAVFAVIGAAISLYAVAAQTTDSDSAFNLLLLVLGVIGYFKLIQLRKKGRLRNAFICFGVVLACSIAYLMWDRGNWHRTVEKMACQLGLDFCIDARLNRISHAFRPLSFTGFNEAFAPDAQGAEQEYCRSIRATEHPMAQVALFTLKRSKDLNAELLVNWRARSISRSWEIRMVVPRAIDEDTPAFVGRLDADLITLRDASFVPGSTELHVRVCGIPVARPAVRPGDETADERHRRFWRFVDLTEIEVLER